MEAQTILGSLVCFPNLYVHIPVLRSVPGSDDVLVGKEDIKVNHQSGQILKGKLFLVFFITVKALKPRLTSIPGCTL